MKINVIASCMSCGYRSTLDCMHPKFKDENNGFGRDLWGTKQPFPDWCPLEDYKEPPKWKSAKETPEPGIYVVVIYWEHYQEYLFYGIAKYGDIFMDNSKLLGWAVIEENTPIVAGFEIVAYHPIAEYELTGDTFRMDQMERFGNKCKGVYNG